MGRLLIKGRCILNQSKPGQRIGSIDIKKEWDAVLVVLVDENFDAYEIHEADPKLVDEDDRWRCVDCP